MKKLFTHWLFGVTGWLLFLSSLLLLWISLVEQGPPSAPPAGPAQSLSERLLPRPSKGERTVRLEKRSPRVTSVGPYLKEARSLVGSGEPERALELLGSVPVEERSPQIEIEMGKIQMRLGRPDRAVPHFERSLLVNPRQPELLSQTVSAYFRSNQSERGESFLSDLSENRFPRFVGPALAYADLISQQGKSSDAVQFLQRKAAALESPGEAHAFSGTLLLRGGEFIRAADSFSQAVRSYEQALKEREAQAQPSELARKSLQQARLGLVNALIEQGRYDEAEREIGLAAQVGPEMTDSIRMAEEHLARRRFEAGPQRVQTTE